MLKSPLQNQTQVCFLKMLLLMQAPFQGILKRDRSDVLPQANKVPRSPVICSPVSSNSKRVRFCDEAVGEPLIAVKHYELDRVCLSPCTSMAPLPQDGKQGKQREKKGNICRHITHTHTHSSYVCVRVCISCTNVITNVVGGGVDWGLWDCKAVKYH